MQIIKHDTHIDFLGNRNLGFTVSSVLILVGLIALLVRGLNFGIDFTGGTLVEVEYADSVDIADVRSTLGKAGYGDALVQYFGTARDISVRLPASIEGSTATLSSEVMKVLRQPFGETLAQDTAAAGAQQCQNAGGDVIDCRVQMRRVEFVGPQVGGELTEKGGLAMLAALFCILIYVAIRFVWRCSIGAIIALVHDVLITIGLFALFGWEFSLPVLAAILAIIGYSLNDTIVVFDRIRENFRKMRKSDPITVMNASINETLPRTILTSLTTALVVLSLLVLGGEVIRGFSIALLIGIVVGTYSSIFVASPIAHLLGLTRNDFLEVKKEGADFDAMP